MAQHSKFPFPTTSEHTTILGRNGSGKTQCGMWLASHMPFDERPLILVDHKGEAMFNEVDAEDWNVTDPPPVLPGVYHVRCKPHIDDEALEIFLWGVHARGKTCLLFDEAYMVAKFKSLDTILMQGRSKEIQCTMLSQRPSWLSRFAFSESSHFVAYHMHDRRDQKTIREFFNHYDEQKLPDFHAQWYEVKRDKKHLLIPVSDADNIITRFKMRLDEMKQSKNGLPTTQSKFF